jgi:hemolysin activation/secretion protein
MHEFTPTSTLALNFIFEREWEPKLHEGTDIAHYYDYSLRLLYFFHEDTSEDENTTLTLSLERSYRIFRGEYNYFLLSLSSQVERRFSDYFTYRNRVSFDGNITPQRSPLFFMGGPYSLVGYEKDEFWGRRAFSMQNIMEVQPFPDYELKIHGHSFRELSILSQLDFGMARGAKNIAGLRKQDADWKVGVGIGFGFTTDLPYMPDTPLHFILASPARDSGDVKFYAGFGGWLR